jgi:hypothetical protein
MFLRSYSENAKLANWQNQRRNIGCTRRKDIAYDAPRIKALESLGFEWERFNTAWKTV